MRKILNSIQIGIILVEARTRKIVSINPVALRLHGGEDPSQVLGRVCHEFLCPNEVGNCPILDQGQEIENSERFLIRADGTRLPVLKTAVCLTLGEEEYLLESFLDLSERKALEEALRSAKEAAEAASRAKSAFVARMSHEVRTPLHAILGYADLLGAESENLTEEQREWLDIINQSGAHLLSLLEDTLNISKIEAGRLSLDVTEFDFPPLLEEVLRMFRLDAEGRGLSLVLEGAENLPRRISADSGKVRQVLINLVGNGVKYTDSGSVILRGRIEEVEGPEGIRPLADVPGPAVSPSPRERMVIREVRDTGRGFAAKDLERIFEPFERFGSRREGGSGLGLPISRQLARRMGGEVRLLESAPEEGSLFEFRFPAILPDGKGDFPEGAGGDAEGPRR
jgi:signal transduction histidine kinase